MSTVSLELDNAVVELLRRTDQPVERTSQELIVIELYRRQTISGGKAAKLLGMDRYEFIQYAAKLGIPYFRMTEDEWQAEVTRLGLTR